MQVKRFFAADMRQAMKLVRDELGADASIIANRRVAGEQAARAGEHVEIPVLLRLRASGDAPGRAGAVFIQRDARAVFEHGLVAASG